MLNDDDITTRTCPMPGCQGRLVIRTNRKTGEKFIGCEKFPGCRYTERVEKEEELPDAASRWE